MKMKYSPRIFFHYWLRRHSCGLKLKSLAITDFPSHNFEGGIQRRFNDASEYLISGDWKTFSVFNSLILSIHSGRAVDFSSFSIFAASLFQSSAYFLFIYFLGHSEVRFKVILDLFKQLSYY